MNDDWRNQAECAGADPEWFFPASKSEAREVIDTEARTQAQDTIAMYCHHCPVILQCAQEAQKTHARDGIWGGVLLYPKRDGTSSGQLSRLSREGLNRALAR
jgi:hypothetical protein